MDWSPKCQPWPETLGHQDAVKQMRTHHTCSGCMDATSIWIQVKYWVMLAGQPNHKKPMFCNSNLHHGNNWKTLNRKCSNKKQLVHGYIVKSFIGFKTISTWELKRLEITEKPHVSILSFLHNQLCGALPSLNGQKAALACWKLLLEVYAGTRWRLVRRSKIIAFAAFLALASFATVGCQNRIGWDVHLCRQCMYKYLPLAEVWVLSSSSHTATAVNLVALRQWKNIENLICRPMTFQNTDIVSKKNGIYSHGHLCQELLTSWHGEGHPQLCDSNNKNLEQMVSHGKICINEHFNDIYQNNASYTVCSRKIENA